VWALVKIAAAFGFLTLAAASFRRTRFREARRDFADQLRRIGAFLAARRPAELLRPQFLAALAILAIWQGVARSTLVVGPGERGVVQRFGRVVESDLAPGLHWHWPAPIETGFAVDVDGVRQLAIGFAGLASGERASVGEESFYLTADENLIDLRSVVHWRVVDPARVALGLEDVELQLRSAARRALVRIAAARSIDSVYAEGRLAVERSYREALARDVETLRLGVAVLDARLLDVHAPASVHDAFRDVASALEDRATEVHDAAGYAAERRSEGVGEAAATTEAARAAAHRQAREAAGRAGAFAGVAAAHAAAPDVTEERLWLESLERALPAPKKYVIAPGAGGGDVDLWVGDGAPPLSAAPSLTPPRASVPREGENR
jgi:membrane protease subunit HflK